jgi:hypothetical protein
VPDNQKSQISIAFINMKREKQAFPAYSPTTHTNHKLQPLDQAVFEPFKVHYRNTMYDWMNSAGNAGMPITQRLLTLKVCLETAEWTNHIGTFEVLQLCL